MAEAECARNLSQSVAVPGYGEVNVRGDRPYTRVLGNWPAIISVEEAKAILAEKEQRAKARRSVSNTYLFSLCVWCAECGRRMAMATIKTIKRDKHKPVVHKSLRCENFAHPHKHRHITESRVLEAVREAVQYLETEENRRLVLADAEINGAERTEVEIATAQQRMEEMHSALHKADDAYVLE